MAAPASSIERLECTPRYSEAVLHQGLVYLSGQVPEHTLGGSAAEQTADVLSLIDAHLTRAGSSRARILSATIYLVDLRRDYADMNSVW